MPRNKNSKKTEQSQRYLKHYVQKEYQIINTTATGRPNEIEIEGKIVKEEKYDSKNQIIHFQCSNGRKGKIKCPGRYRIVLPITQSTKVEEKTGHNLLCENAQKPDSNNNEERKSKQSISDEELSEKEAVDDTNDTINQKIKMHIYMNPEITPKTLLDILEKEFSDYKLPTIKQLNTKITNFRKKFQTGTLDYVRKNNLTENGYIFLRCLSNYNIKVQGDEKELYFGLWMSNFQMLRFRMSTHIYIDGTFNIIPSPFKQQINILAEDVITKHIFPVAFILTNNKLRVGYRIAFQALHNILTEFGSIQIQIQTATLDFEKGLTSGFQDVFQNVHILGCLFHFRKALWENAQRIGLTTKKYLPNTKQIIQELSSLCWAESSEVKKKFETLFQSHSQSDFEYRGEKTTNKNSSDANLEFAHNNFEILSESESEEEKFNKSAKEKVSKFFEYFQKQY